MLRGFVNFYEKKKLLQFAIACVKLYRFFFYETKQKQKKSTPTPCAIKLSFYDLWFGPLLLSYIE